MCIVSNFHKHSFSAHSNKGCSSYKATDLRNGRKAFITSWEFEIDQLGSKCPISCPYIAKPEECQGHGNATETFNAILMELTDRGKYLINNVHHKHLVRYVNVDLLMTIEKLHDYVYTGTPKFIVEIAQEFIEGESIRSICENGHLGDDRKIGKEVLESITYLENKPTVITHGYLNDKSIFMDQSGVCRVADFDLIPYLMYLKGVHKLHQECDLKALGNLMEQLKDITTKQSNDFVEQCRSGRVIHNSDLLKHQYLSDNRPCRKREPKSDISIENFKIEEKLGGGSFGVVLRAKQETDERSYAIKLVAMPENRNEYEKAAREAELISRINHKYVVRYITSWKQQNVNLTEFRNQYGLPGDDESMTFGTSTE